MFQDSLVKSDMNGDQKSAPSYRVLAEGGLAATRRDQDSQMRIGARSNGSVCCEIDASDFLTSSFRDPASMRRHRLPFPTSPHKGIRESQPDFVSPTLILSARIGAPCHNHAVLKNSHFNVVDLSLEQPISPTLEISHDLVPRRHPSIGVSHHPLRSLLQPTATLII